MGYLTVGGKSVLLCDSGTVVPLLPGAVSAPRCPSHAGAGILQTKSFSTVKFEGAHHR